MKSILLGKFAGLLVVVVMLLFGLDQITNLVHERQGTKQDAVNSVAQSLAASQTLLGPLIHQTCTEDVAVINSNNAGDKTVRTQRREFERVAAPATLSILGDSQLEERARGLYSTQVYSLKAKLSANWTDLKPMDGPRGRNSANIQCGPVVLMLAVSDARGIRQADVSINGVKQSVRAGTQHAAYPRGVQVVLPASTDLAAPMTAEIELELLGTEALRFVPLGGATQIKLASNWPHPSFKGQFLPSERTVRADGFEATWRVSSLASTAQQGVASERGLCSGGDMGADSAARETTAEVAMDVARANTVPTARGDNGPCIETVAVAFIDPINTYSLSDRATKYGLLFIALTFVAVGLFEFMRGLRVHPVQYFLVGAAISIFFLLLVSLSEHLPFNDSYAYAASACVLLLGYYASHMLRSWKRGLPFGAGMALLYGLLFLLLQLEQTALVVGALALFAVLAAVMLLTRKVDWYGRLQANTGSEASK